LRRAVGVLSTHTYDLHNGLLNWYPKGLEEYYQATKNRPQESWMTEWEVVTNGEFKVTSEWDILRENIRHFNRDVSTLRFNAWVYWQSWRAKEPADLDQKRSFTHGTTTIHRNTSYYTFRKIWQNAPPTGGTFVRQVTTTDPDLKGESFRNWHQDFSCFISKNKMVLVVCNPTGTDKTLDIKGMTGKSATVYRYTSGQAAAYNRDMTQVGTFTIAKGTLPNAFLAAQSINVIVTDGSDRKFAPSKTVKPKPARTQVRRKSGQ
jgi:hypothetical protein